MPGSELLGRRLLSIDEQVVQLVQTPAVNLEWARGLSRSRVWLLLSQPFIEISSAKRRVLKTRLTMRSLVLPILNFSALLSGHGFDVVELVVGPVRLALRRDQEEWVNKMIHGQSLRDTRFVLWNGVVISLANVVRTECGVSNALTV